MSFDITGALQTVLCQEYEFIYYMDAKLNFTSKEEAAAIGKGYKKDGLLVMDCFSRTSGKKILSACFTDSTLGMLHGPYSSYYDNDLLESQGSYHKNEMNGLWKYWGREGLIADSVIYNNGIRTAFGEYRYSFIKNYKTAFPSVDSIKQHGYYFTYSFTDSLRNTFYEKHSNVINGTETFRFEVNFVGNRGLLKDYDSLGNVKTDSVFTRELSEAEFPGGDAAWRNFLSKNLDIDMLIRNNAPSGIYTVVVKFIVNKDGILEDVSAENDAGYGTAAEAVRVIKLSRKWKPAFQYGRYFKAYRRQPISLQIQN